MAHFAEIGPDGKVVRVLVFEDGTTTDQIRALLGRGSRWEQTSYSGSVRTKFAGVGDELHEDLDAFVTPPDPARREQFTLNRTTKQYEPIQR